MTPLAWIAVGAAVLIVAVFLVPRVLLSRAQDRMAKETMARPGKSLRLLTRAELVVGKYRRIPGILAWRDDVLSFQGIFGHDLTVPPAQIRKIVTADRLSSGRLLFRLEVLQLTRSDGEELEFVVAPDTASAWRRLLGEWAARERQQHAGSDELVTPGRSGL